MLASNLESILFVAAKPLSVAELAKAVHAESVEQVTAALTELEAKYTAEQSGLRIIQHAEKVSLGTAPEATDLVKKFLRADEHGELTRPALETLAVIAYRGPVTKPEIEQIRGVNCSMILRNLLMRDLIEEKAEPNTEATYQVTHALLGHLGLTQVSALPDFESLRHHPDLERAIAELQKSETPVAVPANKAPAESENESQV